MNVHTPERAPTPGSPGEPPQPVSPASAWTRWSARAAALLAVVLAVGTLGMVPAHAADGDLEFTLNGDNKAVITGFVEGVTGITDLVIPATVSEGEDTYPVAEVGANAFSGNTEITSLALPDGLETLGDGAFRGTQITSITIPSSVTSMGASAFQDTSALTTLTFAEGTSLTAIPAQAFWRSGLTTVTIPTGITSIGLGSFSTSQLTSVTLPAGLTTIGGSAFATNQLTTVDLPGSVTTIGDQAFADNQLSSVTVPAATTTLGEDSFRRNALTAAAFADDSALMAIPANAFADNTLTALDLPASVATVGEGAFYNNEIATLTLPSTVTAVGASAFAANALTAVTIEGDGVSLAHGAFGRRDTKGGETGFETVTFAGAPPSQVGAADTQPSFLTHGRRLSQVTSVPEVVYQEEYGEAAGYEGGFTTPKWQGYTAGPAGTVLPPTPAPPTVQVNGQNAVVSWTPPVGGASVTGYKVRITPQAGLPGVEQVHDNLPAGATSTRFDDIAGGYYHAFVTAKSEAGDSESQASAGFGIIEVAVPGTPAAPEVVAVDGQDATVRIRKLNASGGSDITSYTLRFAPAEGNPVLKAYPVEDLVFREVGAGSDNYLAADVTVGDLAPGTYSVSVHATNAIGDGPPSPSTPEFTIESDEPTQQVAEEVDAGEKIVVSGTGWKTSDGTKGSIIAFKLDTGTVARTFDLTYPDDSTATDAFKANKTIWGVVQADATGAWTAELPYPTSDTSDSDLSSWTDGSQHTVQVLSGSLLTGDEQRSVPLTFTVRGSLPATDTTTTADDTTQTYGKKAKVSVSVSPDATGKVSLKAGSKTVTGTLKSGRATLAVPARSLRPGRHTLTVSYAGVPGRFHPSSTTVDVKVVKATPRVKVKAPKKVKRGKTATVKVTVTAPGVKPGGKVRVNISGAEPKTATLDRKGRAVVKIKLGKNTKPGKKKVAVTYSGDDYVAKAKAKAATISVTR